MRSGREKWIGLGQLAVLAFVGFLAYSGNIFSYFSYDDISLVIENPHLRTWSGFWRLLDTGRPVRGISLWLDYRLWGLNARGFHLTNIVIHILCVLAAFHLVKTVFNNRGTAFISALIFAALPVNSEAVIGITHRKELLCFLFMSLSYICFKKSLSGCFRLGLSLFFYLLALLSKQVALVLPVLFLLEGLALNPPERSKLKRFWVSVAVFFLIPAAAFIFSLSDFKLFSRFQPPDFFEHNYLQIMAAQFCYFPLYLKLAFFPAHLNLNHFVEYPDTFFNARTVFGLLLFLASLGLLVRLSARRSPAAFGWGWFLVNLLPVMNFIPGNTIVAERYLYIPSLGACILIALALEKAGLEISKRMGSQKLRAGLFFAANFIYLELIISIHLDIYRQQLWARLPEIPPDPGAFFVAGAAVAALFLSFALHFWNRRQEHKESGIAREFVFFILVLSAGFLFSSFLISSLVYGRLMFPVPEFEVNYQKYYAALAREAGPDSGLFSRYFPHGTNLIELLNFFFYVNVILGIMLGVLNRWGRRLAKSRSGLFVVLLFLPPLIWLMMAQNQKRASDWGSEVSLWKSTVRENPRSFLGWNNLGRAYVERKKYDLAIDCFIKAHSQAPEQLEPIFNLGNTMLLQGNLDAAEHYYRGAARLNPFSVPARLNLGNCLASKKEYNAAAEQYLEVLKIRPDSFDASYNLAVVFYQMGDRNKAFSYLQRTLRLAPNHGPSRDLLQRLMSGDQPSRQ